MSVTVMALAFYMTGLTATQKSVLVAMADHANDEGKHAYPSVERLVIKTNYHERTVRRVLAELRELGLLIVIKNATQHNPTEYQINVEMMEKHQSRPVRESGLGEKSKGPDLSESPPDLSEDSLRPVPVTGKPSLTIIKHPLSEKGFEKVTSLIERGEISQDYEESDLLQLELEIEDFESAEYYFDVYLKGKQKPRKNDSGPKTAEEALERIEKAVINGAAAHSRNGDLDLATWPEDVRPVIQAVCSLWPLKPPGYSKVKKSPCGQWIEGARALADSCAEFGVEAIKEYRKEFEKYMDTHNGLPPHRVDSPFSLVNVVRGKAGEMRGTQLSFERLPKNVTYSEGAKKWQKTG